jgi:hypothetical protein
MNGLLAWTMAAAHLALIVFLIVGAWFTRRWPGVRAVHLGAIAATAVVFLAGADCPLTVWENHFRAAAGWDTYGDGFVVHHLLDPLLGVTRPSPVAVVAAWLVPTLVGYRFASRGTNA